jgi:RNA polymerase sigma-70 factor (ECF subfamily)
METVEGLLDRARQGDAEAVSALYHRALPGIFGYIATRVPDRATAEDLTSEVFLQMVEGIAQLRARNEASFLAWLLRIARVTVAGYYRKREKQPSHLSLQGQDWQNQPAEPLALFSTSPEADPVSRAEAREDWQVVVQAINRLTEEQRQVLVGRLILGYDVATVARMLGKQANAIKALQFRALQSLQRLLGSSSGPADARQKQKQKEKIE